MPAASRVATMVITGATGSRTWVATAAVQDTAAGSSVVVTVTSSTTGVTPPEVEQGLDLNVRMDNVATQVRVFTLTPGSASQTATFFFTTDGTSTGAALADLLRLRVRAVRSTGLGTAQYDATSDDGQYGSAANVYPTGFAAGTMDQGYIRGTDTLTEDLSNTSLGGAPSSPAAYDESLFVRLTQGAVSGIARALSVSLSHGSLSGSTNSTTSATRDVTFTNVVDDRFPAASTSVSVAVTVPNAALVAIPAWTYTTTTDDTILVDPRLTCTHHFQADNDTFAVASDDNTNQMLATQSGFLWTRFVNARSVGVNGLTVTQALDPANPGTTVSSSTATATRDSQAGWTDKLDWTASKPGGSWAKTVDVTAPADIDADTHIVGGTDTYTMLNTDPRVSVMIRVGPSAAGTEDRHLTSGDSVKVAVCVFNRVTRVKMAPDAAPLLALVRYAVASGWQYLSGAGTWTTWGSGAADTFTTIADPVDADCFSHTVSSAGWGNTDLVAVQCSFTVAGTPYGFYVPRELTGSFTPHDVEVDVPTADEIANAVWDETTAETRTAGSYGVLVRTNVDATVSSRATGSAVTALGSPAQASAVTALGSPAQASALATVQADTDALQVDLTTMLARLTSARATLLDLLANLDVAVSTRAAAAALATVQADTDDIQASLAARLDVAVSTRSAPGDVDPLARADIA